MTNVINLRDWKLKKAESDREQKIMEDSKAWASLASTPSDLDRLAAKNFEEKMERTRKSIERVNELVKNIKEGKV